MDHPLNIFRSSSDGSDKDTAMMDEPVHWGKSTPPPLPASMRPTADTMASMGMMDKAADVAVVVPLELFYHRWDDRWWLRSIASRYHPFYCSPDDVTAREGNHVTTTAVDTTTQWHPQALLNDMMRTRRHISERRLIVSALIYITSLVLTMVCGVTGACLTPTNFTVTFIGSLTIMTGVMSGMFSALSTLYTAWEQEVIQAQMIMSTRYHYIPIPYSPIPISFGMLTAATKPAAVAAKKEPAVAAEAAK